MRALDGFRAIEQLDECFVIPIWMNQANTEQRFELFAVSENVGVSRHQSAASALVGGVNVKRVPSVLRSYDPENLREHLGTAPAARTR